MNIGNRISVTTYSAPAGGSPKIITKYFFRTFTGDCCQSLTDGGECSHYYIIPYLIPTFLSAFHEDVRLGSLFLQKEKISVGNIFYNIRKFYRNVFPFARKPNLNITSPWNAKRNVSDHIFEHSKHPVFLIANHHRTCFVNINNYQSVSDFYNFFELSPSNLVHEHRHCPATVSIH